MTVEQTTSNTRRGRPWFFYAWHPAAILLFLVIANVANGVQAQLISLSPDHEGDIRTGCVVILITALVLIWREAAWVIKAVRTRDLARAVWQLLAAGLLVAYVIFASWTVWAAQLTNLFVFHDTFAACERDATSYGSNAKFKSCTGVGFGDNIFVITVYDSGGEIGLPEPQQSQAFKSFLMSQFAFSEGCKISSGQHLYGDFYSVGLVC